MNIKEMRVKQLESVGNHEVWLVDGERIRKDVDENFVAYDEHYHLSFIPKNEFWIDQCTNPSEWHFFIDHLINEQWQIAQGKSYAEANKKADSIEKRERSKLLHIENKTGAKESTKEILEKIRVKAWKTYSSKVAVWRVDGKAVRNYFLIEYADGGHDKVYSFIPKNEIWIEEVLPEDEAKFILLHELHERYLMCNGKDYPHAHLGATDIEDRYRDNPKDLEDRIKKEIQNNDDGTKD